MIRAQPEAQNGHRSAIIWFAGLSGSGKSTMAHAVEDCLYQRGCRSFVPDGDNVRHGLCSDLGFSAQDRQENIRSIGEVAKLVLAADVIMLTILISPYREDRKRARELVDHSDFIEIYCDAPIDVCEVRDVKECIERTVRDKLRNSPGSHRHTKLQRNLTSRGDRSIET